jgi:serine/threonine protein kinase
MNPRESEFEKKNKLGSGSFGTVWLVKQRSDGALFALKEIDLRKPGMQQAMKEVETMTSLPPHRNVVRLHEHWMSKDGKDMWLLLQYCSQGTLAQSFMTSARLPDTALWDLAEQLLQALLLFERHRIVHNDIKPENIFIMEGSIPKIGDLGMARFTSTGSVLTRTPGGTPLFQAPEVLSKEIGADGRPLCFSRYAACEISYQSDVYSVGVVLWSMIMRRNPDRPGGAFPLTSAHVADSSLRDIINDMLQPDPAKRHRASHLVLRFTVPAPALALAPIPIVALADAPPVPAPPSPLFSSPSPPLAPGLRRPHFCTVFIFTTLLLASLIAIMVFLVMNCPGVKRPQWLACVPVVVWVASAVGEIGLIGIFFFASLNKRLCVGFSTIIFILFAVGSTIASVVSDNCAWSWSCVESSSTFPLTIIAMIGLGACMSGLIGLFLKFIWESFFRKAPQLLLTVNSYSRI